MMAKERRDGREPPRKKEEKKKEPKCKVILNICGSCVARVCTSTLASFPFCVRSRGRREWRLMFLCAFAACKQRPAKYWNWKVSNCRRVTGACLILPFQYFDRFGRIRPTTETIFFSSKLNWWHGWWWYCFFKSNWNQRGRIERRGHAWHLV